MSPSACLYAGGQSREIDHVISIGPEWHAGRGAGPLRSRRQSCRPDGRGWSTASRCSRRWARAMGGASGFVTRPALSRTDG